MNKKGFTLVELLMVIVILAVITALTLPNFVESIKENNDQKGNEIVNTLKQRLELLNKDIGDEDFWYEENSNNNISIVVDGNIETDMTTYYEKVIRDLDLSGYCVCELSITRNSENKYTYNAKIGTINGDVKDCP